MDKLRKIEANDLEYLQGKLDFEEVLENLGIEVSHRLGPWIMCHCPNPYNHSNGDQNPSFGFNVEEMRYNCFVCGGGSLLKLVEEQKDLSPQSAVAWLQELSTYALQETDDFEAKIEKILHPVKTLFSMQEYPDEAYKFEWNYYIRDWLVSRGINLGVAQAHRIGFDPEHFGVTIPHWFNGKLRGWQTRHLLHEDGIYYCDKCNGKGPKYLSTHGFPKKETLFNYDNILDNEVIVVESPMSVLSLTSNFFEGAVATFGSFSVAQAELLKKYDRIFIWPDNDSAGFGNLMRVIDELKNATEVMIVPVVDTPKGDAADLSPDQQKEFLENAYPAAFLPFFKGELATLDRAKANSK